MPDFSSMSNEEIKNALIKLQPQMKDDGIDTSGMPNPSEMTDEEIELLKSHSGNAAPAGGTPPMGGKPPMGESDSIQISKSNESTTLQQLLDSLLKAEEEEENETIYENTLLPPLNLCIKHTKIFRII